MAVDNGEKSLRNEHCLEEGAVPRIGANVAMQFVLIIRVLHTQP